MAAFLFLVFSALCTAIVLGFFPIALRFLAELLGSWLLRSSQTRRELLYARVATEIKTYEAESPTEPDDWEEIDSAVVGTAVNGGQAGQDFSGVVGFFHPFW